MSQSAEMLKPHTNQLQLGIFYIYFFKTGDTGVINRYFGQCDCPFTGNGSIDLDGRKYWIDRNKGNKRTLYRNRNDPFQWWSHHQSIRKHSFPPSRLKYPMKDRVKD